MLITPDISLATDTLPQRGLTGSGFRRNVDTMLKKLFAKLSGPKSPKKKPAKRKVSRAKKKPTKRAASLKKRPRPTAKKKTTVSKKKAKARPKRRKGAASKKGAPADIKEPEIGRVVAFFRMPVVAVIKVTQGTLKAGDRIWIKGHTTDLKQVVASMQIDHQPVSVVPKGGEAGVKVSSMARRGDRVYRIA